MAETDKLNIDSIIARLLEGKYLSQIVSLHIFSLSNNAVFGCL